MSHDSPKSSQIRNNTPLSLLLTAVALASAIGALAALRRGKVRPLGDGEIDALFQRCDEALSLLDLRTQGAV